MSDDMADMMADDATDENNLYLETLAEALLRLGIVEMEGVVVDGTEVAGAIMALDAQLTTGWQLAEAVRWSKEMQARLKAMDPSADSETREAASQNKQYADEAVMVALAAWDEAAGLEGNEPDLPATVS
jgi:hypothetical protein